MITLLAAGHGISEGLRFIALFDKDYQKLWKPLDVRVTQDANKDHVVHVEWNDAPIAGYVHNYSKSLSVEYTVEIFPSATEGSLKNQVRDLDKFELSNSIKSESYTKLRAEIWIIPSSQVYLKDFCFEDNDDDDEDEKKMMLFKGVCAGHYKYKETFYGVECVEKVVPRLKRPPLMRQVSVASSIMAESDHPDTPGGKKKPESSKVTISCEVNGRTIAQRTEKVPPALQPYLETPIATTFPTPMPFDQPDGKRNSAMEVLTIVEVHG